MISSAMEETTTDFTEITSTEDDLRRRLDMTADIDDLVVLSGMIAAGKVDAVTRAELDGVTTAAQLLDLTAHALPADEVARFQQLWYHFKVPFAEASLAWWYLFCLALARHSQDGTAGDVGAALHQMDRWLEAMGPSPALTVAGLGDILGLSKDVVVVTGAESEDVEALLSASWRRAPLLWTNDIQATAAAATACGCEVITSDAAAATGDSALAWWMGPPADLRDMENMTRACWNGLPESERSELLATFEQKVTSIERMRFLVDDLVPVDNRSTAKILAECREAAPDEWSYGHLALLTTLWCWNIGGFALQELNQSFISLSTLTHFLIRRIRKYDKISGNLSDVAHLDPVSLARRFAESRAQLEKTHVRCLHFDGSNWERREFLLPRQAMERRHQIPESLREFLHELTGAEFPGSTGTLSAWDRFLEMALEAGCSPTRVMQALAQWSANADDLPIDLAVFTAPLGTKLTEPWTMDYSDIFCFTAFRDGFRPEDHGIPGDLISIQNIQGQRQRYNAVKKAQNYAPVRRMPPQGFNLPDISIAEDANHAGHYAGGVRLSCRVPTSIAYRDKVWNGLSDARLNRVVYRRDNRFAPRDLPIANRYAQWIKGVADATYLRGLTFDEKWGKKVKDLEL